MGVTYERASDELMQTVHEIMREHHKELVIADVRVLVLMAFGPVDSDGKKTGPAITSGGYTCAGTMQRLSLKNRVISGHDALMTLDGDRFDEWPEKAQRALIDHELMHLAVQWERAPDLEQGIEEGIPKYDDIGRPKLATRLHDWQLGGFRDVAQRWGKWSFEREEAKKVQNEHGQYLFDFAAPPQDSQDKAA